MTDTADHDFDSFLSAMGDVKPLASADTVTTHSPRRAIEAKQKRASVRESLARKRAPFSMEGVVPVRPDDYLVHQQPGIQDGVFKNVRMGKYPIDQQIDLKGLTLDQSAEALYQKISAAHEKGDRMLVVRHGMGEQSKPFPALKKSYVKHWLLQLEQVIAFHTAQPTHGGLGATYVLLKKHPQQKLINRERNRRR